MSEQFLFVFKKTRCRQAGLSGAAAGAVIGGGKYYDIKNPTGDPYWDSEEARASARKNFDESQGLAYPKEKVSFLDSKERMVEGPTTIESEKTQLSMPRQASTNVHSHPYPGVGPLGAPSSTDLGSGLTSGMGQSALVHTPTGSSSTYYTGASGGRVVSSFNTATYMRTNFVRALMGY